ncbi:hypothetical protein AK812_SmicGene48304, partial [Symbiodinium microadriaticum]
VLRQLLLAQYDVRSSTGLDFLGQKTEALEHHET